MFKVAVVPFGAENPFAGTTKEVVPVDVKVWMRYPPAVVTDPPLMFVVPAVAEKVGNLGR
jgi:hypothetical protein